MAQNSGLMQGKRGVILGLANNRSIAWGIAKACHAAGAELAFTYQGDALKKRVERWPPRSAGLVLGHCDVTDAATIDAAFASAEGEVGQDRLPGARDRLWRSARRPLRRHHRGEFLQVDADSCYSFTAVAQRAEKLMTDGGSLITLSYYGAEKWMPHYNVMGVAKAALEASVRYLAADLGEKNIRVNAISAGPIKTLAPPASATSAIS